MHHRLRQAYLEAIHWIMLYYYRGCQSWGWFYPFHFAPMTSDMVDLTYASLGAASPFSRFLWRRPLTRRVVAPLFCRRYDIKFHMGRPFFPFQQLLGCLPAASSNFLPRSYANLMTNDTSPLKRYYPDVMVSSVTRLLMGLRARLAVYSQRSVFRLAAPAASTEHPHRHERQAQPLGGRRPHPLHRRAGHAGRHCRACA